MMLSKFKLFTFISEGRRCNTDLCTMRSFFAVVYEPPNNRIARVFRMYVCIYTCVFIYLYCRWSRWPRGLRRRSAAARLLRLCVPIPREAWMSVRWECCVLASRDLCDELITRPEESCRMKRVVVCNLETSRMRRP
jgi:hypothetical protein